jgi:hypothetical protein
MSRFRFDLAGPADEADLRRVLAGTPMAGRIHVAFGRDPDYFAGAVVDGRFRQVVACRDLDSGRIVGFGTRSVMPRHTSAGVVLIGYLGGLRVLPEYRNRGLVARGFAFFKELHRDGRTQLYLTTIAEGNQVALDTLTTGRARLPGYHFAGRYHTLALPRRRRKPDPPPGLQVRPARLGDVPAIVDLLARSRPRRQFFPVYEEGDLFAPAGIFRDLRPEDVWLAWRGGALVGMLAAWDQHAYKQSVVVDYAPLAGWLRPLYNAWAALSGGVPLPRPGSPLRYRTAALPVVDEDDATVFRTLLASVRAALPEGLLLVGLHESDPLWPIVRRGGGSCYTTRLYLVDWGDGAELRARLDATPPYLELGCL